MAKREITGGHEFAVGQRVEYSPSTPGLAPARGAYTVVRLLPAERRVNQYRIKNTSDGHERVALETDLR